MSNRTACRRGPRRYDVRRSEEHFVEVGHPDPGGRRLRLPLLDLSVSGLSFELTEELAVLEIGSSLDQVVVHVNSCELHGDLLVMHVTPEAEPGSVCGALFYPATDSDLVKLKSLLAGIEAARPA